jgi:hypothetical protein
MTEHVQKEQMSVDDGCSWSLIAICVNFRDQIDHCTQGNYRDRTIETASEINNNQGKTDAKLY